MDKHLGVGPASKAVTVLDKFFANLLKIVDLTAMHNPDFPGLLRHGLMSAGRKIEDSQAPMAEKKVPLLRMQHFAAGRGIDYRQERRDRPEPAVGKRLSVRNSATVMAACLPDEITRIVGSAVSDNIHHPFKTIYIKKRFPKRNDTGNPAHSSVILIRFYVPQLHWLENISDSIKARGLLERYTHNPLPSSGCEAGWPWCSGHSPGRPENHRV